MSNICPCPTHKSDQQQQQQHRPPVHLFLCIELPLSNIDNLFTCFIALSCPCPTSVACSLLLRCSRLHLLNTGSFCISDSRPSTVIVLYRRIVHSRFTAINCSCPIRKPFLSLVSLQFSALSNTDTLPLSITDALCTSVSLQSAALVQYS